MGNPTQGGLRKTYGGEYYSISSQRPSVEQSPTAPRSQEYDNEMNLIHRGKQKATSQVININFPDIGKSFAYHVDNQTEQNISAELGIG